MRNDPRLLHSFRYSFPETIRKLNQTLFASEIDQQIMRTSTVFIDQLSHISGIRTTETVNILVIVTYRDHLQVLIFTNKRLHQCKLVFSHILRLINHQNRFCNTIYLYFPIVYFSHGIDNYGR